VVPVEQSAVWPHLERSFTAWSEGGFQRVRRQASEEIQFDSIQATFGVKCFKIRMHSGLMIVVAERGRNSLGNEVDCASANTVNQNRTVIRRLRLQKGPALMALHLH
jgi:hypothetical protein